MHRSWPGCSTLAGTAPLGQRPRGGTKSEDAPRTLLLVELNGGNDGLSCIVPHGDDVYFRSRSRVGVAREDVLKIDDYRGFHPDLTALRKLYDERKLAIVEGAGYPNPDQP